MITGNELDVPSAEPCFNHPRRETMVHCGKCDRPICVKCMVQTPVGMRCRDCARLRRLPQFDVDVPLLARSAAGGLATSAVSWLLITYVTYLSFFAAIAVGFAVAAAMAPLAKRRTSRPLEVAAVVAVVGGYIIARYARFALLGGLEFGAPNLGVLILPLVLASFIAVFRLR